MAGRWILVPLFLFTGGLYAQQAIDGFPSDYAPSPQGKSGIRLMFYNLENLFDPEDDPLKNDDAFTPQGSNYWTGARYRDKLEKTYKVIASVGGWEPPAIVGFCELENRKVIYELVSQTPLNRFNYQVIHEESGDARGIDVALIYRPDLFVPFTHQAIKVVFEGDTASRTRDILLVGGKVFNRDTMFVAVNHWPSKFGGAKETEPRRMAAAELLKIVCDSLRANYPSAGIVLTGDFNDEPSEPSLTEGLKALHPESAIRATELYNLMLRFRNGGTHKFQTAWSIIDQFIVSGNLLLPETQKGLYVQPEDARIFKAGFLVEPDERNLGDRPFRTYIGLKYHGGFSDHLPIYLDVRVR
jgi:hypothetical protein